MMQENFLAQHSISIMRLNPLKTSLTSSFYYILYSSHSPYSPVPSGNRYSTPNTSFSSILFHSSSYHSSGKITSRTCPKVNTSYISTEIQTIFKGLAHIRYICATTILNSKMIFLINRASIKSHRVT